MSSCFIPTGTSRTCTESVKVHQVFPVEAVMKRRTIKKDPWMVSAVMKLKVDSITRTVQRVRRYHKVAAAAIVRAAELAVKAAKGPVIVAIVIVDTEIEVVLLVVASAVRAVTETAVRIRNIKEGKRTENMARDHYLIFQNMVMLKENTANLAKHLKNTEPKRILKG